MATLLNSKQVVNRAILDQIAGDDALLGDILTSINENLTVPFVISASTTPDLTVSIGAGSIQNSQTQKNITFQPISGVHFDFAGGTITLPASAGGSIINSAGDNIPLTISNSSFNKLLVEMNSDGTVSLSLGTEGASIAAAILPEPASNKLAVGYVVVESDGSGNIQVIQNSDLYQFLGGGGNGGNSGVGGINYIENSDAESATTGYATYDDGASAIPVDGTAGTAVNLTFSRNTTSPLRGIADFDLAKGAADAQGEGVSYDFSIDSADQASIIRVSFDYTVSANYADADMGVYIYDVTNATLIRMSKEDIDATSLKGHFVSEFQSAPNSTSYRLIFHVQSTNATAYDFNFDNVQVGPRSITRGTVVTDWESYTPTFAGFGTATNVSVEYRRVGGSIEVRGGFAAGTPTAVPARIGLPAGLVMAGEARFYCGEIVRNAAAQPYRLFGVNGRTDGFSIGAGASQQGDVNGDTFVGASEQLYFEGTCPIQGWSSASTVSEDFGGREVSFSSTFAATPLTTGVETVLDITGSSFDTVSMVDSGNNYVVIPESGRYHFSASVQYVANATGFRSLVYKVNSDTSIYIANISAVSGATTTVAASWELDLQRGDTVQLRGYQNSGGTISASIATQFSGFKIATPQTILGGEVVKAIYESNAGQVIPNDAITIVNFEDKVVDSHNAVTVGAGWKFTAPVSGAYSVAGRATFNENASWNSGEVVQMYVFKNNILYSQERVEVSASGTFAIQGAATALVELNQGEYLDVRIYQVSGIANSLVPNSALVRVYIHKV